jgi:hypothetical protein
MFPNKLGIYRSLSTGCYSGNMKAIPDKSIKLFPQPARGHVEQSIAPEQMGRVRFQGSIWKAKFAESHYKPVMPGDSVAVLGVQGITLVVTPTE